jgi:hypothetical protein
MGSMGEILHFIDWVMNNTIQCTLIEDGGEQYESFVQDRRTDGYWAALAVDGQHSLDTGRA